MTTPPSFVKYRARITPLRPETVWVVDGGVLTETSGKRRRAWSLSDLRSAKLVGDAGGGRRAVHLSFPRDRLMIPAQSLSPGLGFEDRSVAFNAFLAALDIETAAPRAAGLPGGATGQLGQALAWAIGLTAAGAVFMIVAALVSGMADLGLALGARLLFAPILLSAALPWLGRARD